MKTYNSCINLKDLKNWWMPFIISKLLQQRILSVVFMPFLTLYALFIVYLQIYLLHNFFGWIQRH